MIYGVVLCRLQGIKSCDSDGCVSVRPGQLMMHEPAIIISYLLLSGWNNEGCHLLATYSELSPPIMIIHGRTCRHISRISYTPYCMSMSWHVMGCVVGGWVAWNLGQFLEGNLLEITDTCQRMRVTCLPPDGWLMLWLERRRITTTIALRSTTRIESQVCSPDGESGEQTGTLTMEMEIDGDEEGRGRGRGKKGKMKLKMNKKMNKKRWINVRMRAEVHMLCSTVVLHLTIHILPSLRGSRKWM